jgi:hypothetical protein
MKKALIPFVVVLILAGCISGGAINCGSDLTCLKDAYKNYKQAYGSLQNENGIIGVNIQGAEGQNCKVVFGVNNTSTNMDMKTMTCLLPKYGEGQTFSIKNDCTGELANFFTKQELF